MLIVIDFDETASSVNGAQTVLRVLGAERTREEVRARYDSVETTFRQYQEELFNSLTASVSDVKNAASNMIPMRDGLEDLVEAAHEGGHELIIASAGLDIYIQPALESAGLGDVPIVSVSAITDEDSDTITGYEYPPCESRCTEAWAVCKCYPMREALQNQEEVVFVGDGMMADTCAAGTADTVFARSRLLAHCESEGIPATGFDGLQKVSDYVRSRNPGSNESAISPTGMGN